MLKKIKSLKTFEVLTFLLALIALIFSPLAKAIELEISGNGEGSSNEVSVQVESQTEVVQESSSNIQNSVEVNADTGQNSLSGNTGGDAKLQTGDITSQTSITNQTNESFVETSCCPNSVSLTISNNAGGASSSISLGQTNQTTVSVSQNASITNSISGSENSGKNVAFENSFSNTSITTGDIGVETLVENNPVNTSIIMTGSGNSARLDVSITANASDTQNKISAEFLFDTETYINHSAEIENFIVWQANTGENSASKNTGGDVRISTGGIDLQTFIKNFANTAEFKMKCCDTFDPGKPPPQDGQPPENGGNPPGGDNQSKGSENVNTGREPQLFPSSYATSAGGPGVIGLSDTSSNWAQALFFWISLAMIAFGGRLVVEEIFPAGCPRRR